MTASGNHTSALSLLAETDRALRETVGPLASLGPGRERATPLVEIGEQLLGGGQSIETGTRLADALSRVMLAQAEAFPETVFWDAEQLAKTLLHGIAEVGSPERETARDIVLLQREFGRGSKIQFRYAHDFTYGFDWARWVRRDPGSRASVGPLDADFLSYMRGRGRELEELIESDDAKYPRLPPGQPRNPFGFSREPGDEARLFRDLAERDLIPVEAWRLDAVPRAERPFSELREERARALGLCLPGSG